MTTAIVIVAAFAVVAITLVVYFTQASRSLSRLAHSLDKTKANLEAVLKERHDELPKLVETCRPYLRDDPQTLRALTEARRAWAKASTLPDRAQLEAHLAETLQALLTAAHRNSELKNNASFQQLCSRLTTLNERLAAQRAAYNQQAMAYNSRITHGPAKLVAAWQHLRPRPILPHDGEPLRN